MTPKREEAILLGHIKETARWYGWLVYHTYDSRHSEAGFPDLVMVNYHLGLVIFAEIKANAGRVSPEQQVWVTALEVVSSLAGSRVLVFVWRPSDWPDIERVLARGR